MAYVTAPTDNRWGNLGKGLGQGAMMASRMMHQNNLQDDRQAHQKQLQATRNEEMMNRDSQRYAHQQTMLDERNMQGLENYEAKLNMEQDFKNKQSDALFGYNLEGPAQQGEQWPIRQAGSLEKLDGMTPQVLANMEAMQRTGVNPISVDPTQQVRQQRTPQSIQEYKFATDNGFKGSYEEFLQGVKRNSQTLSPYQEENMRLKKEQFNEKKRLARVKAVQYVQENIPEFDQMSDATKERAIGFYMNKNFLPKIKTEDAGGIPFFGDDKYSIEGQTNSPVKKKTNTSGYDNVEAIFKDL